MNKKNFLMFNEDCDFFVNTVSKTKPRPDIGKKELEDYIDLFKNTGVTDFVMNVNGSISAYPCKSRTSYIDKYYITEEMGKPVNYKISNPLVVVLHDIFINKKIDLYKVWIDRCREDGMNPWISFRMNDIHYTADAELPSFAKSSFFYDHIKDYSRIRHREYIEYYDRCHDYSIPEVRQHYLDYIKETLERYDPYGIELDFQRDMLCFSPGIEECGSDYLLPFLREVKSYVKDAEKRYNHKIKTSIRCVPSPIDSIELGFDIGAFAKEGLIDLVIATPRWGNSSYDMPLKIWKQILDGTNTELGAGIENLVKSNIFVPDSDDLNHSMETVCGCMAYMLSQGIDRIYLFNYMGFPQWLLKHQEDPKWDNNVPKRESVKAIMDELYSMGDSTEKILKAPRRHIAACEDFVPHWRRPVSVVPQTSLNTQNPIWLRIATGKILPDSTVIVKLAFPNGTDVENDVRIFVNGKPVKYLGTHTCGFPTFTENMLYCFEIENNGNLSGAQLVEFITKDNPITVDHAEIAINIPFQK